MDMELLRANLLRTLVPIVVGALVTVLPGTLGRNEQLPVLVGFGVSWLYYAVFRIAETRYPKLGVFLGKTMPSHQSPRAAAASGVAPRRVGRPATLVGTGEVEAGSGLDVRVGGVALPAVESITWHHRPGGAPLLRVEMAVGDGTLLLGDAPVAPPAEPVSDKPDRAARAAGSARPRRAP